jgi:hypothetical protein
VRRARLPLLVAALAAAGCTTRGARQRAPESETTTVQAMRRPGAEVPAPVTTWTKEPRLVKEGTNAWRLQGVQRWEAVGEEYRDLFLEQETTVRVELRAREPDGSVRAVGTRTLDLLEVFPCKHAGTTAKREANDLHDCPIDVKGACAGTVTVEARLRLGRLHLARPGGALGERVTEGGNASAFRFHLLRANFKMRRHEVEKGFAFEPRSPATVTRYAFEWDECGDLSTRGDAADRVPVGGVVQRPLDP